MEHGKNTDFKDRKWRKGAVPDPEPSICVFRRISDSDPILTGQ
jgi:hypothetical protein